jgi:two-component system, sensor histidine kinase
VVERGPFKPEVVGSIPTAGTRRATPRQEAATVPTARPDLKGFSVLIVEDHDDSRDAMRQIVESLGATVLAASGGPEALSLTAKATPDVILCDLVMPGMDGFELMTRLRQRPKLRRTPVVALSGLGSDVDQAHTAAAGFAIHLVKPVDFDAVAAALGRLLADLPRRA